MKPGNLNTVDQARNEADFQIRDLNRSEMLQQLKLLQQLNPKLEEKWFPVMLDEMLQNGYAMAAIFDGEKCAGVSGYWISTKLYCGRYLEMDNVVVDEAYRSKGLGKMFCEHFLEMARQRKCRVIMLDAYLENKKAHSFYEREGFEKKGYHFIRKVDS